MQHVQNIKHAAFVFTLCTRLQVLQAGQSSFGVDNDAQARSNLGLGLRDNSIWSTSYIRVVVYFGCLSPCEILRTVGLLELDISVE